LNVAYQTGLISLAGATGGSASISRSVAEIPSAIEELLDRIEQHYAVTLELPATAGKKVSVSLEAEGGPLVYRAGQSLEPSE
jgi:hypothetical protein